jgi:hypothetical protein
MSVAEEIRPQAKAELRHARMLIDGVWVGSMSGETLTVETRQSGGRSPRSRAAMRPT